ncbi:MAG: hypothetical protein LW750_05385 [Bacteroidetes bacterium]|nr:hypothetical protein [Bacteroidota bacterium]
MAAKTSGESASSPFGCVPVLLAGFAGSLDVMDPCWGGLVAVLVVGLLSSG